MAEAKTLILRFSDFDGNPTVALHDEVLEQSGQVWWGWWRKTHEPQRLDVLEAVKRNLPETFGLIDRRAGKFYRAPCIGMEIAPVDEEIPTPDPALTPEYYGNRPKAAWFLFTEIKEIKESDWNELFKGFGEPEADSSLFWIDENEGRPAGPEFETPVYEATMPGDSILHISDLHYGDDHGYPVTSGGEKPTMRETICDAVREGDRKVGLLVVSGDLTTQCDLHFMSTNAKEEIAGLAADLELPLENVVVVPGNHDIKLLDADPENFAHEFGYRTFLDELFGEDQREPEAVFAFEAPNGHRINVATLNSVRLSNKRETKEYGYVGVRSKYVFKKLSEVHGGRDWGQLASEGVLNMVVLHHHLVSGSLQADPPESKPVSVTLDAGKIVVQAQKAAVHVALHGHEHIPLLGSVTRHPLDVASGWDGYRRPLYVIGAGSAGADITRLKAVRDNTFGLYTPTQGGLEVTMKRFTPNTPPVQFLETTIDFTAPVSES